MSATKKTAQSKEDLKKRIEQLEEELSYYKAENSKARFYRGVIKQMNDISSLFESITITEEDLKSKDDKFIDRYFKYLEKVKTIMEGINEVEKSIVPQKEEKKAAATPFEEALDHGKEDDES